MSAPNGFRLAEDWLKRAVYELECAHVAAGDRPLAACLHARQAAGAAAEGVSCLKEAARAPRAVASLIEASPELRTLLGASGMTEAQGKGAPTPEDARGEIQAAARTLEAALRIQAAVDPRHRVKPVAEVPAEGPPEENPRWSEASRGGEAWTTRLQRRLRQGSTPSDTRTARPRRSPRF